MEWQKRTQKGYIRMGMYYSLLFQARAKCACTASIQSQHFPGKLRRELIRERSYLGSHHMTTKGQSNRKFYSVIVGSAELACAYNAALVLEEFIVLDCG
jgi:hypothetical protein